MGDNGAIMRDEEPDWAVGYAAAATPFRFIGEKE